MLKKEYSETFPIKKDPLVSSTHEKNGFMKIFKLRKEYSKKSL
jgi:hypothetical protein